MADEEDGSGYSNKGDNVTNDENNENNNNNDEIQLEEDDLDINGDNKEDDNDGPTDQRPRLWNQQSKHRAISEKKIDKKDFKKYRGMIKKRLSSQQRMPFDQLVARNIHAGFEDELYEKKPMEKSKKILQLNRRLSHRPQPSDIQNDEELPPDLKKADSEYYKLYKYRQATEKDLDNDDGDTEIKPPRTRTSSDPNPPNKPVQKIIKPAKGSNGFGHGYIDNPLDWKFGQRSSTKELQIRGIIPEQYADVVHGSKSLEEAKQEWEAYRKESSKKIKNKIGPKFRPTKEDLQDRGIVPDWENPNAHQENVQKNRTSLKMKIKQRMDPQEAHDRALIDKEQLLTDKDYKQFEAEKKQENKKLKAKMQSSIEQRADKMEIVQRGIVREEYLEEDRDVASKKIKDQRVSVKQQMNTAFGKRPERDADDIAKLILQPSESNPVPQPTNNNSMKLDTPISPYGGYGGPLPTTPEYDEIEDDPADFPTFLDRLKAEKKQTKQVIELHMRRRSTMEDLQKQGILPMQSSGDYDADADDGEVPELHDQVATQIDDDDDDDTDHDDFISFLDRMKAEKRKNRNSIKALHRKRPSREELIQRGIYRERVTNDLESKPQVYISPEYANSLNNNNNKRRTSDPIIEVDDDDDDDNSTSSSDDTEDEYPTFLDRMREEKEQFRRTLEIKHSRRPSVQDLEKQGIVEKGYFENMQVALTNKRKRRKSFTSELANFFQQRPDIAEMLTKGLVAAEFIGMDALEMANKRKAIKSTLNKKLNKKRRPTMDDLEMRGIVPAGYFSDAQKAVTKKHTRRMTAEKELGGFLPKRMAPKRMLERGLIPKQHYEKIMGVAIPIGAQYPISPDMIANANKVKITEIDEENEDEDDDHIESSGQITQGNDSSKQEMTMNQTQQAFSSMNGMGVASVYAQKMVKQTIESAQSDEPIIVEPHHADDSGGSSLLQLPARRRDSKRVSSGIANIVLDLPQHAERNLFNHDNWTQNLYESLLNSLRFGEIVRRIEKEKTNDNYNVLAEIMEKYQQFERLHHTKMNGLQRDKKIILEQIQECQKQENDAMDVLKNLIVEHSSLEQKIRPQMKMLLHKMTLVETRIIRLDDKEKNVSLTGQESSLRQEYQKELNYYDTYITELKNVFIHTNNIRSKYQNTVRTVIEAKDKLQKQLRIKENEIDLAKKELNNKFEEFHNLISKTTNSSQNKRDKNNLNRLRSVDSEQKYDPLASDPIVDLQEVLNEKTKTIDTNLDLLSFRISTIPATDYALRVIELCQLSYIYSQENLKSFFEWFIRYAVESFIEINYAHTCFVTQNRKAIDDEIGKLNSIKYIANLTPTPQDNVVNFDTVLYNQLTLIISYLELLPSNNEQDLDITMTNNNIDHEYVIFHVARYLTADFTFSQKLIKTDEEKLASMARDKVQQWINVILQSTNSSFKFSKDYNKIENLKNKSRNIIKATKQDSTAQVRPARAAAIVLDHVYGIHVHG